MKAEEHIKNQLQNYLDSSIINDRKYLDDEQLDKNEQYIVLKEIFDSNIREHELSQLSLHFAPILKKDHPVHLSILGKTGTGKTVTFVYFYHIFEDICKKQDIPVWFEKLDITTPKPVFRVLNDFACLINASKRYQRGISLDELMCRIEEKLADYRGYFILFIDEIDHCRTDSDALFKFLVRRLPQNVPAKIVLVFASNKLNWIDNIDPKVKSFLKITELIFNPYNATDLHEILKIRVEKALDKSMIDEGALEKIAAISCRETGDARKAVELLILSAQLAEQTSSRLTLETIDRAWEIMERNKYTDFIKRSPKQLQTVMYSIILLWEKRQELIYTGEAYEVYCTTCRQYGIKPNTQRAVVDLISELEMYGFINSKIISKGRFGRTREISLSLPKDIRDKIRSVILNSLENN